MRSNHQIQSVNRNRNTPSRRPLNILHRQLPNTHNRARVNTFNLLVPLNRLQMFNINPSKLSIINKRFNINKIPISRTGPPIFSSCPLSCRNKFHRTSINLLGINSPVRITRSRLLLSIPKHRNRTLNITAISNILNKLLRRNILKRLNRHRIQYRPLLTNMFLILSSRP